MSSIKVTNLQHASAASPAIVLAADGTATAQLSSINGGPISGARNRIINGDMRIDQRNAGASVTPTNSQYLVDRWQASLTQASKYTAQQNAASVTPPAGFRNYLGFTSSSAYSVLSGDIFGFGQIIEGFNIADLGWGTANAQSVTLSFWVRSSLTGSFGGAIKNDGDTRNYPFSFSITAANTWEYKTIIVSGDTSGAWGSTNGAGINIRFSLGTGSTYSGTAGAWTGTNVWQPTGSTSVVATNGATFYITGVQLEAGTVATPFERRSYGQELALCQRYFQLAGNGCFGAVDGSTSTVIAFTEKFFVPMRVAPTVTWRTGATANWRYNGGDVFNGGSTSLANTISTANAVWSQQTGFAGLSNNLPVWSRNQTSTGEFMACNAEL